MRGGGRVHRHGRGGGGNKRLTFPGVKAARDVELQPIRSFDSKKTGGNLNCGPPTITAALTSLPLSPPSSTRLSTRSRIDEANSLNAAIAGCRHRRGHHRRRCRRRCIRCSHRCRHRCHHRRSKQPNFLACRKKYRGISKTTNSSKLPVSKQNSAK